jgi:hypothetical protein
MGFLLDEPLKKLVKDKKSNQFYREKKNGSALISIILKPTINFDMKYI